MFLKIFLFEIGNRSRRPAAYLYFSAVLLFTLFAFATGSLPLDEKEHINSPYLITFWCCSMTLMMTLVSSSVMGTAIFRDIEYQTKDYYLTYPVTKAGYFWGRYLGSFAVMIFVATAIPIGIYLGTFLGPVFGKTGHEQYGLNNPAFYLYPFLLIALPNLFFTSSLFFGLVALTRNVKVIYFGGILLFLLYFIALFFLGHTGNITMIDIADPFWANGIRYRMSNSSAAQQNNNLITIHGALAINRLLWPGLSLVVLLGAYLRFNFQKFFAGKWDKAAIDDPGARPDKTLKTPVVNFTGNYKRSMLRALTRLELLNILRDNYFWLILGAGGAFLGFVFWLGDRHYGIPDLPRTVTLLGIFANGFHFYLFFIILFYTGETLQRDRLTRYAFIYDSLPPPNWVLNGSKLLSLLIIAAGLSLVPLIIGVFIQLVKGFTQLNLAEYLTYIFVLLLPRLLAAAVFCYVLQVIFNHKFAAYAVGVTFWVGMFLLDSTGTFDYHLLLYSYTPKSGMSDMDGMGHMVGPVLWFDLYWLLAAGLLIIIAALFYNRGVSSSIRERVQLIPRRFDKKTRWIVAVILPAFLAVGCYIYYNVSYLNEFLTKSEKEDRAIIYEKTLKYFQDMPLPKVTCIKMHVELFPGKKQEFVNAKVTIVNKNHQPITAMLLDGDELTNYSIRINGRPLAYTSPLLYARGFFSWFGPKKDTAKFRLYKFETPLAPGDSTVLQIRSSVVHQGFANEMYAGNLLNNGTAFSGGLPGLGYDDDDEITSPYVRRKAGLPVKEEEVIAQDDPAGIMNLRSGKASDLFRFDLIVGTEGDQTVISQGEMTGHWKANGRNYFHYAQDKPGMYAPFVILSGRLADRKDSVMLDHQVSIDVYYEPGHGRNIDRYIHGYKDALNYYSKVYGAYPFNNLRLVETAPGGPWEASTTTTNISSEQNGWNAHFNDPGEFDYLYANAARMIAGQWWRFQVAPNSTEGSLVISEGLATYDGLVMNEKKYGKANIRGIVLDPLWPYLFIRHHLNEKERPVIKSDQWFEWGNKAGVTLYGLRELIGEDSLNDALLEFKNAYAFRKNGPFAGANDLYRYLQKHTPDSVKYYLTDTWQKVTIYDNKINSVSMKPTGNKDQYQIDVKMNIDKFWLGSKGQDSTAVNMNDYIDIGVWGQDTKDLEGRTIAHFTWFKRYKFKRGDHELKLIVNGRPKSIAIDPLGYLIDRNPNDNIKNL